MFNFPKKMAGTRSHQPGNIRKALSRNNLYMLSKQPAIRGRKSNYLCKGNCLTAPKTT